ncbi:PDZ domain-containing protein [Mucisphaera sp.]|uniref:PDZ domain-containing protein n=1 Tax=Mucisphaera sp. TaxID=2913024 RepID=UPI003D131290
MFVALLASTAGAQGEASSILEQLNDPDYATREAASGQLLTDPAIDLEVIAELLSEAPHLEQQERLLAAARHRFVAQLIRENYPWQGPGSIGIIQRPADPIEVDGVVRPAILVIQTLPGFPAHQRLRPGDRLIAIDGEPLTAANPVEQFQTVTQATPPGGRLGIRLWRAGRTLDVAIETAPLEALRLTYAGPQYTLTEGPALLWQGKRAELVALTGPAAGPEISVTPLAAEE